MLDLEETSHSSFNNKLDNNHFKEDELEKQERKCVILIPKYKSFEEDKGVNEEIKDNKSPQKKDKDGDSSDKEEDEEEKKSPKKKDKKDSDDKKEKKKSDNDKKDKKGKKKDDSGSSSSSSDKER